MNRKFSTLFILTIIALSVIVPIKTILGCSTFKLQKGNQLIYGHNLNEGDIGVPGLIFLNKRGIYKYGRTWDEIITKNQDNPSSFSWISRYGSVTFNNFGRDFPDGGMNETGLVIWEMNEDEGYPKNDSLPKLNQMSWMQYILDNCSSVDEAIECAYKFEIDGWGWHFFVGDNLGNTAAIAFIDGKTVVHTGETMQVPALFNTPYKRELELLKYFEGFGGNYAVELENPKIPRFVKTAALIKDFEPGQNAIDYGFKMLDAIKVNDEPEWSIIFDSKNLEVYFKTRLNPKIKSFSMNEIDFSNENPVMVLNMDIEQGGNVANKFEEYSNQIMKEFTSELIFPILPSEFFTWGGLSMEEYLERVSTHTDDAKRPEKQFFNGTWKSKPDNDGMFVTIMIESREEAIDIKVSNDGKKFFSANHIQLAGNVIKFTFKTGGETIIEVKGTISIDEMNVSFAGIENFYGSYLLFKTS